MRLDEGDYKFDQVKKWADKQTKLNCRLKETIQYLVDQNKKLFADIQQVEQSVMTQRNVMIVLSVGTLACLGITQYQLGLLPF